MPTANILLIESARANAPSFAPALDKKGYLVSVHHKVASGLKEARGNEPDIVIIDAASMKTSGTRLCRKTRAELDGVPIILVTVEGARPDPGCGSNVTLVQPFTPRKLLNRVARLLPGDESYTLEMGPIQLNQVQSKVRCLGKEARLTPKLAQLLEVFMQNPGRLMTRKRLIRLVWHTDYTGDTRTLDVHMSWLRRAIEPDPKSPRFLKTIRGMGYRLDIPQE
jgi:DNA-binding response OmpR family regulator